MFPSSLEFGPGTTPPYPTYKFSRSAVKMGHMNDALSLASIAHLTNNHEPKTNFMLGLLHLHFSNHSVAVRHFDRAIKVDPDSASEIEHYKLIAACHAIEKETAQHLQCQGVNTVTAFTFKF